MPADITDITALKQAEAALSESRTRYQVLFEMESDAILMMDNAAGAILEANEAAAQLYGYTVEALLTMKNSDLSAEPEETTKVTKTNPPIPDKIVRIPLRWHKKADGTVFPVEITGRFFLLGERSVHIAAIRDISERIRAEEERIALERRVFMSQKLDAVGYLAGGIAHDFNNLLAGIYGNIQLAQSHLKSGSVDSAGTSLAAALSSFERAKGLTRQLLTFSKGGAPLRERGDLARLIRDSTRFAMSGSRHRASLDIQEDLLECEFDSGQIGQVLDNLIINAQQAMATEGRILIRARNMEAGEQGLAASASVEVSVSDTGQGMDEETLKHLFEPFFTTKPDGNGLGLATSRSIISRHGGRISVRSQPGEGTTVSFFLPAAEARWDPYPLPDSADSGPLRERTAGKRVLVMDDEASIRELLKRTLGTYGFSVRTSEDGASALSEFQKAAAEGEAYDVIILDLTIPSGKGGREIAADIRAADPRVRIIASSGYSRDPVMAEPEAYGFNAALPKPWLKEDLDLVLDRLLR